LLLQGGVEDRKVTVGMDLGIFVYSHWLGTSVLLCVLIFASIITCKHFEASIG
jgi:hypothetical protein